MINAALDQLGIKPNDSVHATVRAIRERITRSDDLDKQLNESKDILALFNVSMPIDFDPNEARLLATALVAESMQDRDGDLSEIIDRAKERVNNIKSMGLNPTPVQSKHSPSKPVQSKSVKTKSIKTKTRSTVDITAAVEIFSKDTNRRVYDIVTDVAAAYNVDRAKAYSIMAKARKHVNG
jgi:hypothetical protein